MTQLVYKICSRSEWAEAVAAGAYGGSDDDRRDGFIHLSSREQVAGTLAKFFAGRSDLVLVAVEEARLGDRLRWEASSSGALYPHVYGVLPAEAAVSVTPLEPTPGGGHRLPAALATAAPKRG